SGGGVPSVEGGAARVQADVAADPTLSRQAPLDPRRLLGDQITPRQLRQEFAQHLGTRPSTRRHTGRSRPVTSLADRPSAALATRRTAGMTMVGFTVACRPA